MKKQSFIVLVLLLFSLIASIAIAEDTNAVDTNAPEETPTPTPEETPTPTPTVEETPTPTPEETPEETPTPTVEEIPTPSVEEDINPETGEPIVSGETGNEIMAMQLGPGAKVRLLQLEKAIMKRILRAEKVIEYIEDYPDADTSELAGILAELQVLKEEVLEAEPQGNNEETVKQFVDLKNDAISLTKQFRETASEILSAGDKTALLEKFKEIDRTELKELNQQIVQLIREYNAQRVERVFSKIEEKKPEFVKKIRNGKMKMVAVKGAMVKAVKALKPVKRANAFRKLRQVNARKRAFKKAKIAVAKTKFLKRRVQRLNQRVNRIGKKLKKIGKKLKVNAEKIKQRIKNRINKPKAWRKAVKKPPTVKGRIKNVIGGGG